MVLKLHTHAFKAGDLEKKVITVARDQNWGRTFPKNIQAQKLQDYFYIRIANRRKIFLSQKLSCCTFLDKEKKTGEKTIFPYRFPFGQISYYQAIQIGAIQSPHHGWSHLLMAPYQN